MVVIIFEQLNVSKMNDLELSLDDIIKKKLKTGTFRGRNNVGTAKKPIRRISDSNSRVTKNQNALNSLRKNPRTGISRGNRPQPNVGDARLRLIQKQRQKITDAREKLGQIAKQTDARLKLVKLRERPRGNLSVGRAPMYRGEHQILQRTIQSRINNTLYDDEIMDYTDDVPYYNRGYSDAGVISDDGYSYSYRNRPEDSVLYRTIEMSINRINEAEKNIYTWTKPPLTSDDLGDIPVARPSQAIVRTDLGGNVPDWDLDDTPIVITKKVKPQETVGILKRSSLGSVFANPTVKIIKESPPPSKSKAPTRTLSERFCHEGNVSAQKISLLKAKLEACQKSDKINTPDTSPLGHRIVVSNLVSSVSNEDVKELFEDIGELISSKVVRPGTAEVVYKLHKDAVKAVDVYHNRQLDGQPMKCLLVNNKTILPASKSLKDGGGKIGKTVVEVDLTAFRKALHKKSAS